MKAACFIPIKTNSERVSGKNLRILNGKKLYQHICEHVREANVFDDIYIDTDSNEISSYAHEMGFKVIERKPELALASANGNDLLIYHHDIHPDYDFYFQCFATAPFLQPDTIKSCYEMLISNREFDSCFTATANYSFYWYADIPINYRPNILPRSQDLLPVIEETTGLYGITQKGLDKYHCRIGKNPYIHLVDKFEAVDINTEIDFSLAEYIGKIYWHLEKV